MVTGADILQFYRERSPPEMRAAVKSFLDLTERERDEVMFFMVQHLTRGVREMRGDEPVSMAEASARVSPVN